MKERKYNMEHCWRGFRDGAWTTQINVADFIRNNYTPYEGTADFLKATGAKYGVICVGADNTYDPLRRTLQRREFLSDAPFCNCGMGLALI